MPIEAGVTAAEQTFFNALVQASREGLTQILTEDFILIDLSGARLTKPALMELVGSGQLKFESITPVVEEFVLRVYSDVAVVTGRTQMRGQFGGAPFEAGSRYTHVYALADGQWRLATAQGTPVNTL